VSKEATGLEVVLVFDNTGSMASQSRLSTLKVAANDFVEILFGPRDEADTLKVAVVPFSQFVNVGPDKSNNGVAGYQWLSDQSRDNFDADSSAARATTGLPGRTSPSGGNCTGPAAWKARPGALSVNDTTPNPNIPDTLFVPAFAPDEPGQSGSARRVTGTQARHRATAHRTSTTTTIADSSSAAVGGAREQSLELQQNTRRSTAKAGEYSDKRPWTAQGLQHPADPGADQPEGTGAEDHPQHEAPTATPTWPKVSVGACACCHPGEPFTEGVPTTTRTSPRRWCC
jgi:hypothetical protein